MRLSRLEADALEKLFITVVPEKGKDPHMAFEHLADVLREETAAVARIRRDGCVVGSVFDTGHARCCRLGGLTADPGKPRTDQAREVFEQAEGLLAYRFIR